ncbi:hypothetical protein [Flavobacterium columnare]|uniref:hypothetical protein n=1 Tax=Flavobacterium columnare TaxID=996 RepID=UPI0007FB1CFA|nr:hypothetical protein [Flavobacterium columnare]
MNKILVLILLSLGLFFNSCNNTKVYKEYSINDLNKPLNDTLKSDNVDNKVVGVEIIIVGQINGEALLEFENGAGRYSKINLKNKVNQTYETEWYSPKIFFRYNPISEIKGDSLKLKYRMY